MSETNPTAAEFAAMLADFETADEELSVADGEAYKAAAARYRRSYDALLAARPTDPAAMAAQLQFLATRTGAADDRRIGRALAHIGYRLQGLVGEASR